jgi:pyrrolysine biosynthesis protein PylC
MCIIKGESGLLVGIVGGKLQGIEAAYLARKAGWEIRLVDKNDQVPALRLGDTFVRADVTDESSLASVLGDVDFILPAFENDSVLESLNCWCYKTGIPLAFDIRAYAVSSSKLKSNDLFRKIGLPVPDAWPRCGFPVLVKPGRGSGSNDVRVYQDLESLTARFSTPNLSSEWIVEAYIDGSQHSIEVLGRPGKYRVLEVTDLYVDHKFDCKRVIAPSTLEPDRIGDFERLALTIAEALNLNGIMDVEVIHSGGEFKILEIDARLPSQTPTAVFWSTGVNMVALVGELYTGADCNQTTVVDAARGAVYEHIRVSKDTLFESGERIMTRCGPLRLKKDFFGADEALTNYSPGIDDWVATLIFCAADRVRALEKRQRCISEIVRCLNVKKVYDRMPEILKV